MDILTPNLFSVPPQRLVPKDRGPAPVNGSAYTNLTLAAFLRTYRLHGIYGIGGVHFKDASLGLHDPRLGFRNDRNFRKKKNRVKLLYEYAKAESQHTCLGAHNLLFVSTNNPTLLDDHKDYEEWSKRVDDAANQVARAVFNKLTEERKEIGKKPNQRFSSASAFLVGTATNAIEEIRNKKNKKTKEPMVADPEASDSSESESSESGYW